MSAVTLATVSPSSPQPAWIGTVVCGGVTIAMGDTPTLESFTDWLIHPDEPHKMIAVDTETGSANDGGRWEVRCVTMARGSYAVVLDPRIDTHADMIRKVLSAPGYQFVLHNASYDIPILVGWGLAPESVCDHVYDTLITANLMPTLEKRSLEGLAERYLGLDDEPLSTAIAASGYPRKNEWFTHGDIDRYVYASSAARDTAITLAIGPHVHEEAITWLTSAQVSNAPNREEAESIIHEVQTAARAMLHVQCQGLVVDTDEIQRYRNENEQALADAKNVLESHGLRPGISSDVVSWLDEHGHITPDWPRTKGGALSGDKDALKSVAHIDVVSAHLTYAEVTKVLDSYLNKFESLRHPLTGRIHPQIETAGAQRTGRQRAGNPPIQQIPASARPMISTGDEEWVSIDWSSVEPVIAAYASGETWVTDAVNRGEDLYIPIARRAGLIPDDVTDADSKDHPGRKQAKQVLLGLLYGMGVNALATGLGTDENTAASLRNSVLGTLPKITAWSKHLNRMGETAGVIVTAMGRVLHVPKDQAYKATNYFHQGSGADLLIGALAEFQRRGIAHKVRLTVHDEVICTSDVLDEVRDILENYNPAMIRQIGHMVRFPTDANPLPGHWDSV